jgi:hypothetical protein
MAISIGTSSFPTLTAQPFGYDEVNTRAGQTARKWTITGLLKPSEWLALLAVYDAWRNIRINEEDSATSGVIGTTVAFSGKGPGGQTWTSIACWFSIAPAAQQSGKYLLATVELVDANQALAVLLKQQETEATEELPDLGTYVLGTATLTLLKPIEAYGTGPGVELTATGNHYITGPLVVQKVRDIEGTTNSTGWAGVRTWYEAQIVTIPSPGAWYPIGPPSATAAAKIVGGVKTTEYTVAIQLGQII